MGTTPQRMKVSEVVVESLVAALVGILVMTWSGQVLATESIRHPLDPLAEREYAAVVSVLEKENYVNDSSSYPLMTLDDPVKAKVLQWKAGDPVPRRAFVIVKNGTQTFEGIVDITDISKGKVVSWKEVKDVQPGILLSEEWTDAQQIVQANRQWQAAVRKRGIDNLHNVVCIPHTVGYYGIAEEEGRRLVKVTCYDSNGTQNFWGRPLEGLIAVVDHDKHEVVKLIDTGVLPVPKPPIIFSGDSEDPLRKSSKPILNVMPQDPNFKVNGHVVTWQKWQFHFRIDPRLGLVVSMVRFNDHGKIRSILYQGSLSELFVPYMDPDVGWYFRTYMDAGEYGVGKLAAPLQPDLDCPPNAVFFEAVFANEWGDSYTQPHAACLFERNTGDIAWRHYEPVHGQSEVRRRTDLVLRLISTVGSYDYIFDWVFQQDGTIKVTLGATGIPQVKAVRSRTITHDRDGRDTAYGHMVADHTVAINHDHFFCFRIDMDVDGQKNSFLYEGLRPERSGQQNTRRSVWVVERRTAITEPAAKLRINTDNHAFWRVINPNIIGPLGYPVSYQLKPLTNAVSLLSLDDFPQRRAGWADFHLWVTPYNPQERYAAGTYPNQSKGGDGLPRWTKTNRSIHNTDIVLWYTLGMHHVVRSEDWPIMPTAWSEFELRPFDFFQHNPEIGHSKRPLHE